MQRPCLSLHSDIHVDVGASHFNYSRDPKADAGMVAASLSPPSNRALYIQHSSRSGSITCSIAFAQHEPS